MDLILWKQRKKNLKLTFDALSNLSNVPKRTLEDIFSGRTPCPRIDTVQAIEKALGIDGGITSEEYEQGARYTKKVSITADEEDILDKSREVIELLGENGTELIIEFCDMIIKQWRK